jgi:DNA-binding response OmpR family regulator
MQSKHKKILVVDDEPDILGFLQELLEMEGYDVTIIDNTQQIEAKLAPNDDLPDIILFDVFLTGKDGSAAVKRLKQQEATRHIPIIMFSAHPKAVTIAKEAGANDFIEKPFEIEDLLDKITKYA